MLPEMQGDKPYLNPEQFGAWYADDYFRRTGRPGRRLWYASGLAVACCSAWLAVECLSGNWRIFQAGPVSAAHARDVAVSHADFGNECTACHTQHFRTWTRLVPGQAGVRSVPDEGCLRCHAASPLEVPAPVGALPASLETRNGRPAPIHQETQTRSVACAECHREHRDRPALSQVTGARCTTCHARLERDDGRASRFENVTGFPAGHPEFGRLRRREADPARLSFNHEAHLRADLFGPDGRPHPLACQACHQAADDGRYMRPVTYAAHCAACHPLTVRVNAEGLTGPAAEEGRDFARLPLPHGQPPPAVRVALQERFAGFVRRWPEVAALPVHPQHWRVPPFLREPPGPPGNDANWVAQQVEVAERRLFTGAGGCRLCHVQKPRSAGRDLPEYEPTGVLARWLGDAVFSHVSDGHRREDCSRCHAARDSSSTQDVLLPGIASCGECHAPRGLARADCGVCHQYHGASHKAP